MNEKKTVEIKIYGSTYTLKTDAEPSYLYQIANHINKKIDDIIQKNPSLPSAKVIILALIEIVDDLIKAKSEISLIEKDFGSKTAELINKIEKELSKNHSIILDE